MANPTKSFFQITPDLAIHLNWSTRTAAFVQEWQQRIQAAETPDTHAEEHVAEAASMVLGTVEQLDTYTAQVLSDIHHLSGQLPGPKDRLLVGPLELRVEERQFAVSSQGGFEQVIVTYCIDVVRYLYEAAQTEHFSTANFSLTV